MLSNLAGKPPAYYLIFAASGFAGLIYESIWARYLNLILGHAAYAQALVLAIFLLGLAVGSAACARISPRISRPLLGYVIIEVAVAIAALLFHDIFVAARGWLTGSILPSLESDTAADLAKWVLAAALIFPQSVLLGATFPLMSAGLARRWPGNTGMVISMLYFSNSFGAAIGVLASGLLFIPAFGLPGTSVVAALINLSAAGAVWLIGRGRSEVHPALTASRFGSQPGVAASWQTLVLGISLTTGLASFVYEIVWIRMLSLLLGSSSHSFEVMLSAFILGLALGGYAVRRIADRSGEPMQLLATVQLAMGTCALLSLFMFPIIYELLRIILSTIERDPAGYRIYVGLSMALAMLMMLPATFCAGMTLPLLTKRLMMLGGESAIGSVYAANTLGAICGVFLTLHILLPQLGIQGAMLVGGAIDLLVGVAILAFLGRKGNTALATGAAAVALLGAFSFGTINPRIAAAGVFRYQSELPSDVIFYKEGKTASISVTGYKLGTEHENRSIRTNGKPDAGIYYHDLSTTEQTISDEKTMTSLGLYPLLFNPDAKLALNIGFGAGFTSRTLLLSDSLVRLDNVEIEPVMVEGARLLGQRVAPVFSDQRTNFIFDDAKSVLSRARGKYDIIISEPSNPWVSGVAGLYTREFYADAAAALAEGGIFIQWYHTYESDPHLFASIIKALAQNFSDFRVFATNNGDILI
ncbi:MAG: fused MFS/spermidine synthase, partial [Betaproteobacteria bacterium]|nr:fused MFS/spermidine synthase [Betaproteobacteria bacterium]